MRHIFVFVKSSKIWEKWGAKNQGLFLEIYIQADWTPLGNEMIVQLVKQQQLLLTVIALFFRVLNTVFCGKLDRFDAIMWQDLCSFDNIRFQIEVIGTYIPLEHKQHKYVPR